MRRPDRQARRARSSRSQSPTLWGSAGRPGRRLGTIGLAIAMLAAGMLMTPAGGATPRGIASKVTLSTIEYMHPRVRGGMGAASVKAAVQPNLVYRGGSIQAQPRVYLVFYGSQWASDPAKAAPVLQSLLSQLYGPQDTWSTIMNPFCQGTTTGAAVCSPVSGTALTFIAHPATTPLGGVWLDNGAAAPANPSPGQVAHEAVVAAAHFGNVAPSANGSAQYVVATAHGDSMTGFGTQWCAWHSFANSSYGNIAFTYLPYIPDAGWACGANFVNQGSAGTLDGLTMVEGHEYAETVTDPMPGSGWTDSGGAETGDKCAWLSPSTPGGAFSLKLGGTNFVMQGLWSNTGTCLASYRIALPVVTGISPPSGPAVAATTVTLSGTNLSAAAVTVADVVVPVISTSANAVVVKLAAHPAGAVQVVVATSAGTAATTFTYVAAPVGTALSVKSGPAAGGTAVSVIGANLSGATVTVGGRTAKLGSADPTGRSLNFVAPTGVAGQSAPVVVTTAYGSTAALNWTWTR